MGATIVAGNVSGDGVVVSPLKSVVTAPGVVHFHGPFPYREEINFASEAEETKYHLTMLEKTIIAEGHDKIAAIILETVVGANGVIMYPEGYLAGVRALCDKYGIFDLRRSHGWFRSYRRWVRYPELGRIP